VIAILRNADYITLDLNARCATPQVSAVIDAVPHAVKREQGTTARNEAKRNLVRLRSLTSSTPMAGNAMLPGAASSPFLPTLPDFTQHGPASGICRRAVMRTGHSGLCDVTEKAASVLAFFVASAVPGALTSPFSLTTT
jgi:hypothetical protein